MSLSSAPPNTSVSGTRLSDDSEKIIDTAVEVARCAASLRYFARHVKIQNQNQKSIETWQQWPYLLDLFDIFDKYSFIYIVKASQLGVSWAVSLYIAHLTTFSPIVKCLLLSQGQVEAWSLLDKTKFI